MPNADYWKKRFLQLEAAQNQKGKNCCKEIEQQYRTSIKSIDKKINEWYGRLAANNDVTVQDAYKLLDANELKEFKWDVNQYIKYGRENGVNGRWMKELENASAKYHISRLEAMKMNLRQEIESLTARQQKTIDKTMRNVYKDGYMHTAYEIQKGMHIGWDFSTIDKRKIDKVINSPWAADGKNFSERIWGNGTKLVGELNRILTQNIILGESPQKAIDKLSKRMDVSKRAAGRLVMTEQAFFSAASQREAFKELDVEEFEIVATLDSHTSNICRSMDGKHFPMSKWEVGVNAPPYHVYCRSTTVPYFDDEEELGIVGERAARNEDGEVYYVPGNMTYKEWEQAFVKGGAKDDMEQLSISDFLEKSVEKGRNDGIIKVTRVVSGHGGAPKKETPGAIIDHIGKNGKVETRTFYGKDSYKEREITNHDHGYPKKHPYGKHGEHAHDYKWNEAGKLIERTTRELTEIERKENGDII